MDVLSATGIATLLGVLAAAVALARLYVNSRRSILFNPLADFADGEGDRGKSLADLLLFHLREIQNAHTRSAGGLDLRNPYDDIPAFQQELDANLTAAVELQRESRFAGPIVNLLLVLMPVRPAQLRGSIHRFGEELRVTVVLEHARRSHRAKGAPQWTTEMTTQPEELPRLIEDLAYEIYLDLAQKAAFREAKAFRKYTEGLSHHLRYGELNQEHDWKEAKRLYDEAIEEEPQNSAALYNLGVLHYYLFEGADNVEAGKCFREALAGAHGVLRAQIHSGLANHFSTQFHRFKSGEPEDLRRARVHAEEALGIDSSLDLVLKAAAYAYHQSSQEETDPSKAAEYRGRAETYYLRAIEVNPGYYTAHNNLANLYLEMAKTCEDADARRNLLWETVELCEETMAIRPSYHHAYDNLGNAYYELALLGDKSLFDEAARYYQDALRIEPDYAEAANDLAMLHLTPGWRGHDPRKAAELHQQVIDLPESTRRTALLEAYSARRESIAKTREDSPARAGTRRRGRGRPRDPARRARRRRRRMRELAGLPRA